MVLGGDLEELLVRGLGGLLSASVDDDLVDQPRLRNLAGPPRRLASQAARGSLVSRAGVGAKGVA